jgi:hypothetical protein
MSLDTKNLLDTLRKLAADTSSEPTILILAGNKAIEDYVARAGKDLVERRRLLWEVDHWIASEPRADHFWFAMHNAIAQLINELPEQN